MTNKSDFNLFINPQKNNLSSEEQHTVISSASAALNEVAKKAGQAMSAELAKGNGSGGMFLAASATGIAETAKRISEHSNKHSLNNNNSEAEVKRLRAR